MRSCSKAGRACTTTPACAGETASARSPSSFPPKGELAWVTPGFEEARARELIKFSNDVRVWQEDESPYKRDRRHPARPRRARARSASRSGSASSSIDGVRQELPSAQFVSATPVTAGCRMIKSPAEIALMQQANDITLQAIGATFKALKAGHDQRSEVSANVGAATQQLGGNGDGALVIFGKYTAFPHGSIQPQKLGKATSCSSTPDARWRATRRTSRARRCSASRRSGSATCGSSRRSAQNAAFAAAQIGATCESVDAAARKVITDAGFGPGYKVPGLPHRTGHGIGLDGHEWTNFVQGNTTKIQPGMCFSDEPTIAIYGEFGIRLEDCLHITESGPKFFTPQSLSLERPIFRVGVWRCFEHGEMLH